MGIVNRLAYFKSFLFTNNTGWGIIALVDKKFMQKYTVTGRIDE
jgi:hypothetical protein